VRERERRAEGVSEWEPGVVGTFAKSFDLHDLETLTVYALLATAVLSFWKQLLPGDVKRDHKS
jgi:hypothetical protein